MRFLGFITITLDTLPYYSLLFLNFALLLSELRSKYRAQGEQPSNGGGLLCDTMF